MKPDTDGWNIVLVGFWNRMIFTPEWVTQKLTSVTEVGVEVPVGMPNLPLRLVFEGVNLRVEAQRLVVGTDVASDDRLQTMERVAVTALRELPHTPVRAAGVNFRFVENEPSGILLKAFDAADLNTLADGGYEVRSTHLRRELVKDGTTTNLSLTLTVDSKVVIDLNFHCGGSIDTVKSFIDGRTIAYQQRAFELLQTTYGLEP